MMTDFDKAALELNRQVCALVGETGENQKRIALLKSALEASYAVGAAEAMTDAELARATLRHMTDETDA